MGSSVHTKHAEALTNEAFRAEDSTWRRAANVISDDDLHTISINLWKLATGCNLTRSTSKTSEEREEWEDFTNTNHISAQLQADLFGQDLSLMSSVRFNKAVYVMCASAYQKTLVLLHRYFSRPKLHFNTVLGQLCISNALCCLRRILIIFKSYIHLKVHCQLLLKVFQGHF